MTIELEGVSITLGRLTLDERKFGIMVKVRSMRRPNIKFQNEVDPGKVQDQNGLLSLISVAAAACAESLGKKYGDNIDPVKVGQLALRAFREECHLMKALNADIDAKLKRVAFYRVLLSEEHRNLLEHCEWLRRRGEDLTPDEVNRVNDLVKKFHAHNL